MPPTGSTAVPCGSTARSARSTEGLAASDGKSFSASAPAASIAKASVGVKQPGTASSPCDLAARVMVGSACGVTISLPPAWAMAATWASVITVPAPISRRSPKSRARVAMEVMGSGELSGTSMMARPAVSRAVAMAAASSGRTPRRMAMRGQRER